MSMHYLSYQEVQQQKQPPSYQEVQKSQLDQQHISVYNAVIKDITATYNKNLEEAAIKYNAKTKDLYKAYKNKNMMTIIIILCNKYLVNNIILRKNQMIKKLKST